MTRRIALTIGERIGLSRLEAANYIGVTPAEFDLMVVNGQMPPARQVGMRRIWHRRELDTAFAALPHEARWGETANERSPYAL